MTTPQMVNVFISQICTEIGCTPESIYSKENNSWVFSRGSINIEVLMTSYQTAVNTVRTFLRCVSPIFALPVEQEKKDQLLREAMENNATMMGIKLAVIPNRNFLYAIAERDIEGMDYLEFKTMVGDLGYWADQLDDLLIKRFGLKSNLN